MNFMEQGLQNIVKRLYGSSAEVEHWERWGGGALNQCYAVRVKSPAEKLFIKIENDFIYPSTRRGQMEREVYAADLARRAGIDCPRVWQWDFTHQTAGLRYVVSEFVEADLIWELKDQLTDQEREGICSDSAILLEKLNAIRSPVFGDIYPEGPIGQHASWGEAFQSSWMLLLNDCQELEALTREQLQIAEAALPACLQRFTGCYAACLYHGDLGIHNMLADRSQGCIKIGKIIDFGNAIFTPVFLQDEATRRYAGLGLPMIDVEQVYGVSRSEVEAALLLGSFEWVVFAQLLKKRYGRERGDAVSPFIEQCKTLLA